MPQISEMNLEELNGLPSGGERFLNVLAEKLDLEKIRAIKVFGSAVTGEVSNVSDLDLIIVLKDENADYRDKAKHLVASLAEEYLTTEAVLRNIFEDWVDSQTGMFRSDMVTTESAVREGRYSDIGNVSRFSAFGPWRIILAKIFDTAVTIYGDRIEPEWGEISRPEDVKLRELFKSFLVTFPLSAAQIIYALFSKRSILYSMEGYKWTAYNCAFLVSEEIHGLETSLDLCPNPLNIKERFRELREGPSFDYSFILRSPLGVIALHLWAFVQIIRGER